MANRFKDVKGNFSVDEIKTLFKSKDGARLCQELAKSDPAAYREAQAMGRQLGFLGEGLRRYDDTPLRDPHAPRQFSPEELAARLRYSEDEIRALYKGNGVSLSRNLATIARDTPEELPMLREAACSYGFLSRQAAKPTPPKPAPPAPPALFVLDDAMADQSNLPRGSKINLETYAQIQKNLQEKQLKEQRAAIAKDLAEMHNKDNN